jgi:hypothetical protein
MKTLCTLVFVCAGSVAFGQSIVGRWQLSEQKTCFQADVTGIKESETEKELTAAMGASSATGVARVMTLDQKGRGEEGVMSVGKKKGTSKESFTYQVSGSEFQVLDKKSGLVTKRWIIDELSDTSLKMHDAARDCETKSYTKVK